MRTRPISSNLDLALGQYLIHTYIHTRSRHIEYSVEVSRTIHLVPRVSLLPSTPGRMGKRDRLQVLEDFNLFSKLFICTVILWPLIKINRPARLLTHLQTEEKRKRHCHNHQNITQNCKYDTAYPQLSPLRLTR